MDDTEQLNPHLRPTATRPLLGLTVLVVEDSRFACDAMRLLCLRSGARIRRADCLQSARRHLQVYRPSVVIIDLGLPDGSGADLISELAVANPRVDVILGISGDSFSEEVAIAAGADGFMAKPISSVAVFQNKILSALPVDRQPPSPRLVSDDPVRPDPMAYVDDMAHAADVLEDVGDEQALGYVAQFLTGVAHSAGDNQLEAAAQALAQAQKQGAPVKPDIARVSAMLQERMSERMAM